MATIKFNPTDQTVLIYDSFYKTNAVVNAAEYDAVYSFFFGVSNSKTIAGNYTVILFNIAQQGGYNVMELLQTIKGTSDKLQMNSVICYYLNTFKSKASMYGISNVPKPNQTVQRNIVM